jgi:nucleoid-associated protein YgaU
LAGPVRGQTGITRTRSGRGRSGFRSLDRGIDRGLYTHDRGDRPLFRGAFAASCQALDLAFFTRQLFLPLVMAEVNFRHIAGRCLPATAAAAAAATAVAAATAAATTAAAAVAAATTAATAAGLVLGFIHTQ